MGQEIDDLKYDLVQMTAKVIKLKQLVVDILQTSDMWHDLTGVGDECYADCFLCRIKAELRDMPVSAARQREIFAEVESALGEDDPQNDY